MLASAGYGVNPIIRMAATTPLNASERALLRAKAEHIKVANIGNTGRWVATSSRTGSFDFTLLVEESGRIFCSCPAGQRGLACKHAAKVRAEISADAEARRALQARRPLRSLEDLFV